MGIDLKQEIQTKINSLFIQTAPFNCSVVSNSNIITVNNLQLSNNYLQGRTVTLSVPAPVSGGSGSDGGTTGTFTEIGTYNILSSSQNGSNYNLVVNHTFTETSNIPLADIQDDTILKQNMTNVLTYLNTTTPSQLILTQIPTYNDYFYKIEQLCESMIQYTENYINKTTQYNEYTGFVNFNKTINVDNLTTSVLVQQFLSDVTSQIGVINNILSENEAYFIRLKATMADLKTADLKVNNEMYQTYYDSRSSDSKSRIDSLYNAFSSGGKEAYSDQIQLELKNIKIQR